MSWLDGAPLLDFIDQYIDDRNTVAHNMFRAWYVPSITTVSFTVTRILATTR